VTDFILFAPFHIQSTPTLPFGLEDTYLFASQIQVKVNWSCRVSLIFSHYICPVFNLIQFLSVWHKCLNVHNVEKYTSQGQPTGTIWKQCILALYSVGGH